MKSWRGELLSTSYELIMPREEILLREHGGGILSLWLLQGITNHHPSWLTVLERVTNRCNLCNLYTTWQFYKTFTILLQYYYNTLTILLQYFYNTCTILLQCFYNTFTILLQYFNNTLTILSQHFAILLQYFYNTFTILLQYLYQYLYLKKSQKTL